jgi:hypothetical protein
MGFTIVHPSHQQLVWLPVLAGQTIYTGQIVSNDASALVEGVQYLPQAAGASNTTNKDIPLGVVVGNNNISANVLYSSTYKSEYITAEAAGTAYNNTRQYQGVEGPWPKGDPIAMVLVALIDPTSILRGPLYNAAVGTAPTEVTVTVGSGTDGLGCTTGATDVASVATLGTIYARTGKNAGVYRTLTSASTTTHTWLQAMPKDMEVGDKALIVPLRPYGISYVQITMGQYIDVSQAAATHYFGIDVIRLDLKEAGKEYCEFRFNADNFCLARA